MERDDGGPAYPVLELLDEAGNVMAPASQGMSLRDYFAAKAMHAELLSAGSFEGPAKALADAARNAGMSVERRIAVNAYELADAMLAARKP